MFCWQTFLAYGPWNNSYFFLEIFLALEVNLWIDSILDFFTMFRIWGTWNMKKKKI